MGIFVLSWILWRCGFKREKLKLFVLFSLWLTCKKHLQSKLLLLSGKCVSLSKSARDIVKSFVISILSFSKSMMWQRSHVFERMMMFVAVYQSPTSNGKKECINAGRSIPKPAEPRGMTVWLSDWLNDWLITGEVSYDATFDMTEALTPNEAY